LALGLALASGAVSLLEIPAPARNEGSSPTAAWDLLALVRADANRSPDWTLSLAQPFGESRAALRTPIPVRVGYPVAIPADASLDFSYAVRPIVQNAFQPALAEPTRFRVVFADSGGREHILLDNVVDVHTAETDRRWFDARIDLAEYAGQRGTLAFTAALDADPTRSTPVTALFATPRVLRRAPTRDPSLLLVTVDCLRADHVGAYGYHRPTTPALDALAAEGLRFARDSSTAPMTLPSIPQLLNSTLFPRPGQESLVTPFATAGIPSAAIVNNVWIALWLTLGRDAVRPDTFDDVASGDLQARAIVDRAIAWLERHRDDRFALYLHFLDAHTPYAPPRAYARRFRDPAYAGPVGDRFDDVDGAVAGRYDTADRARIVSLYDGGVRYVDDQIGRLLAYLRETGRLDRTVFAVTADHGEELWDHGSFFHGQSLFEELLHVPLIVRLPDAARAGTVVERRVRSIDVAPSLLEWAGLPRPASFTGRSLDIETPDVDQIATATTAQFPTRYAIRTASHKLVESLDTGTTALYDLDADPGERSDRLADEPGLSSELATRLFAARAPLREHGFQVAVAGPDSGRARFRFRLEGRPGLGVFQTIDRTGPPVPGMRLVLAPDGSTLDATGEVDAKGAGFRFDIGAGKDPLRVTLEIDGAPAGEDAVRLGRAGTPAVGRLDTLDPALATDAAPACPSPASGVRVCVWRHPEAVAEAPPSEGPDAAARERLRALGYVQ
jgi:arylsulfatase A-like enzyme